MKSRSKPSDTDVHRRRTVVFLGERDDALDLGGALEHGDGLLGGVGDDERPPARGDEAERVERAGRGRGRLEERRRGGRGGEEGGLRGGGDGGHGGRRRRSGR